MISIWAISHGQGFIYSHLCSIFFAHQKKIQLNTRTTCVQCMFYNYKLKRVANKYVLTLLKHQAWLNPQFPFAHELVDHTCDQTRPKILRCLNA